MTFLLASCLIAGSLQLSKSLSNLNDFYNSCLTGRSTAINAKDGASPAFIPSIYRDAIQYELVRDTIWVKVFITTDAASSQSALEQFRGMNLRSLSQFGNIFAAKIDLMQLPELNRLAFVERIEPVVPDGVSARASRSTIDVENIEKKK
ncbi:MAG: hypothetical protein WBP42_12150 [Candidatus Zixiibacteriota bacterium]